MAALGIARKNGYLGSKGLLIRRASLPRLLVLEIGCRRMHLQNGAGRARRQTTFRQLVMESYVLQGFRVERSGPGDGKSQAAPTIE